ncbi:MAG: hypothetical protein K6E18_01575 [Lachnospiraceae bacterium]|nr:hypothetical protein [Lachnospiraceae bacterium]
MLRILYSDIRKTMQSRAFLICLITNVSYHILLVITLKVLYHFFFHNNITSDEVAFSFASIAIFLVTASTLISAGEFSDGTMRNKLISGAKRSEVFFSGMITGMYQGFVHAAAAFVTSMLTSLLLTTGFEGYTIPEVADYWLLIIFSCMSIAGFSTALVLALGGRKISYVVGLSIAFGMKIFLLYVQDKLYPESGNCSLTGVKLAVFRFTDRFIPYSYLAMRPHWDSVSYILGCGSLILISAILGVMIFQKKELL